MLGHLVYSRYASDGTWDNHATRGQSGWLGRLIATVLRLVTH